MTAKFPRAGGEDRRIRELEKQVDQLWKAIELLKGSRLARFMASRGFEIVLGKTDTPINKATAGKVFVYKDIFPSEIDSTEEINAVRPCHAAWRLSMT